MVEDEYKTWSSMSNEHDIVQHFSNANNNLFLCVVWKMLLDTDTITSVAFKVNFLLSQLLAAFLALLLNSIFDQP